MTSNIDYTDAGLFYVVFKTGYKLEAFVLEQTANEMDKHPLVKREDLAPGTVLLCQRCPAVGSVDLVFLSMLPFNQARMKGEGGIVRL